MAVYDSSIQKLVVRIVYDGPGTAGKTTNLQQLYGFFSDWRRGELHSTPNSEGRTQSLDWLQLDGGLVRGHAGDLRPEPCRIDQRLVVTRITPLM